MQDRGSQEQKSSKKSRLKWLVIGCLVILVLGIVGLLKSLSSPTDGVIKTGGQVAAQAAKPETAQKTLDGQYISLKYPDGFAEIGSGRPAANQLEIHRLAKGPSPFWNLAVSVSQLPNGNPADDASYNLRKVSPGRFSLEHIQAGQQSVDVFADQGAGFSKVAFVPHGQEMATIALTSSDIFHIKELQQTLTSVLNSLEWKS
jgi:hypothetical protein